MKDSLRTLGLGAAIALGLGACGEDGSSSSSGSATLANGRGLPPQAADRAVRATEGAAGQGGDDHGPSDELPPGFECGPGPVGEIRVRFACDAITVITCRDLSNVVIEYEDGTRERFEGLTGQTGAFRGTGANAGKPIARVWIKAGGNLSGEGPGYGTRFDAPDESCDPPSEEPPGEGDGDGDGDDGECDGLDEDCGGEPPPPVDPPDECLADPERNPLCHVD